MSTDGNGSGVNAGVTGNVNEGASNSAKWWKMCGKCGKPGQSRMVKCSECQISFHYECVRITSEVLDGPWVCNGCLKRSIEASNNVLQIKLQEEQQRKQQNDQQQRLWEQQWREQNPNLQPSQSGNVEFLKFGNEIVRVVRQGVDQVAAPTPGQFNYQLLKPTVQPGANWMEERLRQLDEYNQDLLRQIDRMHRLNTAGVERTKPDSVVGLIPERAGNPLKPASIVSKASNASAAMRAQKLKALEEKQALERKQLEEKLALEQELLEQETLAGSEADAEGTVRDSLGKCGNNNSSGSNFLNITKWLEELERPGRQGDEGRIGTMSPPQGNRSRDADRSQLDYSEQRSLEPTLSGQHNSVPRDEQRNPRLNSNHLAARHTVKDLPRFGGDPAEWPRFIAAYERTTKMCGFGNDENLERLERSLYGRALFIVNGLLLYPENVPQIINTLQIHCGNPELVVETMVQRVRAMPPPKADRMDTIIDFGVAVQNLCATMKACHMNECLYNVALLQELVERLPPTIKINWAMHRNGKSTVSLADFSAWFEVLIEALSKVARPCPVSKNMLGLRDRKNEHVYVHSDEVQDGTSQKSCFACEGDCPTLEKCERFQKLSPQSRWNLIKEKNTKRHFGSCDTKIPCGRNGCPFLHHQLLHDDSKHKSNDKKALQDKPKEDCNAHQCCLGSVLFKYAKVTLHGKGKSITTYAFLDSGSTCSLMEHSLWEELGLDGEKFPLCIGWTAGQGRYEANSVKCAVEISGSSAMKRNRLKKVHTVESLELPAQSMNIDDLSEHYRHLSGLPVKSYENVRPRILLGMDNAYLDQPIEAREGGDNQPVAALTRLGWIVYGPCSVAEDLKVSDKEFNYHICQCDEMYAEMKQYFMLDSLGVQTSSRPLLSKDDERAINMLKSKTILEGNHYSTGLLWKFDDVKLPESRSMALSRLRCLEKRMVREPTLAATLQAKIQDYEQKGYIRKLTEEEEREHRNTVNDFCGTTGIPVQLHQFTSCR